MSSFALVATLLRYNASQLEFVGTVDIPKIFSCISPLLVSEWIMD